MTNTNTTPAPRILDLDSCDASIALCDEYAGKTLTVAEFDRAMRRFAAEKNPAGGYAKLRGTFAWTDADGEENTIGFRIDVDFNMSEGATLAQRMMRAAKFWATDRAVELCRGDADEAAEQAAAYRSAAVAALEAAA